MIDVSALSLTSQARYVRVGVPRRALHASGDSPCHLSAKHRVLGTCLPLTAPFSSMLLTLGSGPQCLAPKAHREWVGSGRVTLWHVSPIPPLDPYVRLSPHTAHERGILWERSISPAPRSIHRGQLYAFAGYLCTVSRPSPSGPSPWTSLSYARTTMAYLTAWRTLE